MTNEAELLALLTGGGDERGLVDPETGRNRYHLDPASRDDLFSRGSCTANALTPSGHAVALEFLERHPAATRRIRAGAEGSAALDAVLASHAARLRTLVSGGCEEPFEVFWAPSGSDLMYLPLLFQRLLEPRRPIRNLISCPEELGSGSSVAADGRFFGAQTQAGPSAGIGQRLGDLGIIDVVPLPARDRDGNIADRHDDIATLIDLPDGAATIANLVYGSKSGIEDDLGIIESVPGDAMWAVDLCQFRVDPTLIGKLLASGVLVMLTGSKYFESPPFCAALLVPERWAGPLRQIEAAAGAAAFRQVVAAEDVPPSFPCIRHELHPLGNWGLRLRWEIALAEMEAHAQLPAAATEAAIHAWNRGVCALLEASPSFEPIPDQHLTNASIVSFQVLVRGRALSHEQLADLFREVVRGEHDGFGNGCRRVFFGQPVRYPHGSFLRLALGSHSVRARVAGDEPDDDARLLEVIESAAYRMFG